MDKLMIEEDRRRGNIPWPVYQHFLAFNGGLRYTLLLLLTMTCFQICLVMSSIYLQIWTTNADQTANTYYLKYYAIISLNVSTFLVLRIALVFSSNLKMIHKLHQKMSAALLYAPINKFFDRIPIGRILNRLSKDLTQMVRASCVCPLLTPTFFFCWGTLLLPPAHAQACNRLSPRNSVSATCYSQLNQACDARQTNFTSYKQQQRQKLGHAHAVWNWQLHGEPVSAVWKHSHNNLPN